MTSASPPNTSKAGALGLSGQPMSSHGSKPLGMKAPSRPQRQRTSGGPALWLSDCASATAERMRVSIAGITDIDTPGALQRHKSPPLYSLHLPPPSEILPIIPTQQPCNVKQSHTSLPPQAQLASPTKQSADNIARCMPHPRQPNHLYPHNTLCFPWPV
ncbi:uncharacterized protein PGTG_13997 [Puccinia graminis f. sp. tritici CRL 75-36-700-3]|uniref:Uncharacterized protein n=1 Tax=Puccinia graminis f. sp. tritici (strain CRL 75-36-700-3 / race SCCL) TaxID=418459 RepID=E3KVU4_PUCGT|nr:uncharacterized protein PGTG_13997 [Puccinia graminis f. sp. tritici CRL 75-36-700-3]EFP88419.1 hypothetical protein PGTG_13997 [Puccinia graminis f. sp. tritici CRL 75-36-700-3]